jgi:hypothetical protein
LLPPYTTDEGGSVLISSDTWPGVGGVLGLTRAQIAEARANGLKPLGGGGFCYMRSPDGALVEYAGNIRSSASTMASVRGRCVGGARLLDWYRTHLNAPLRPGYAPIAAPTAPGAGLSARGRHSSATACSERRGPGSNSAECR